MVDIYAKNLDERGRNFMCERTLPSFIVWSKSQSLFWTREIDYDIVITAETLHGSQITTGKHQTFGEAQALIEATLCFEFGRKTVRYQNLTKLP